jgi:hypothetical protein
MVFAIPMVAIADLIVSEVSRFILCGTGPLDNI